MRGAVKAGQAIGQAALVAQALTKIVNWSASMS
jgi:hypothetical protein